VLITLFGHMEFISYLSLCAFSSFYPSSYNALSLLLVFGG